MVLKLKNPSKEELAFVGVLAKDSDILESLKRQANNGSECWAQWDIDHQVWVIREINSDSNEERIFNNNYI